MSHLSGYYLDLVDSSGDIEGKGPITELIDPVFQNRLNRLPVLEFSVLTSMDQADDLLTFDRGIKFYYRSTSTSYNHLLLTGYVKSIEFDSDYKKAKVVCAAWAELLNTRLVPVNYSPASIAQIETDIDDLFPDYDLFDDDTTLTISGTWHDVTWYQMIQDICKQYGKIFIIERWGKLAVSDIKTSVDYPEVQFIQPTEGSGPFDLSDRSTSVITGLTSKVENASRVSVLYPEWDTSSWEPANNIEKANLLSTKITGFNSFTRSYGTSYTAIQDGGTVEWIEQEWNDIWGNEDIITGVRLYGYRTASPDPTGYLLVEIINNYGVRVTSGITPMSFIDTSLDYIYLPVRPHYLYPSGSGIRTFKVRVSVVGSGIFRWVNGPNTLGEESLLSNAGGTWTSTGYDLQVYYVNNNIYPLLFPYVIVASPADDNDLGPAPLLDEIQRVGLLNWSLYEDIGWKEKQIPISLEATEPDSRSDFEDLASDVQDRLEAWFNLMVDGRETITIHLQSPNYRFLTYRLWSILYHGQYYDEDNEAVVVRKISGDYHWVGSKLSWENGVFKQAIEFSNIPYPLSDMLEYIAEGIVERQ